MNRPTRVYFFGTCLIDLLFPNAGLAGMQLLRRAGVEVIFPPDQSCCGQPAFNSGYRSEALSVARAQLNSLEQNLPVIVPSASCAGMIRNHWPELFAGQPEEELATAVAARTWELSEFLVDVLEIQFEDRGKPVQVTLHHSCSARRETASVAASEQLLGQLAQVEVVPHAYTEECCGFGGTFAVKQPELSAAMARSKCAAVEASGAQRLISQDCGCLMHLSSLLDCDNRAVPMQHIAAFLLERSR